jgi:hypothetical protein
MYTCSLFLRFHDNPVIAFVRLDVNGNESKVMTVGSCNGYVGNTKLQTDYAMERVNDRIEVRMMIQMEI